MAAGQPTEQLAEKPIPVSLITGFLGAGKSTLINRILAEFSHLRFGLIVNEFGDVGLESQIIEASEDEIFELSNGCMCCVVRTDMKDAVRSLVEKAGFVDHILMEASGLSDPAPIAQTFLEDDLDGAVRLAQIVCVVDAENFRQSIDDYEIALAQLSTTDFVLLSKTHLAGPRVTDETRELIDRFSPSMPVYVLDDEIPLQLVFDGSTRDHAELSELHHEAEEHADHDHETIESLFFQTSKPLDMDEFGILLRDLPEGIVRAKGFFYTPEEQQAKLIVQLAGARREFLPRSWRSEEQPQTALLFLGKGFDSVALERRLRACETSQGAG